MISGNGFLKKVYLPIQKIQKHCKRNSLLENARITNSGFSEKSVQ